MKEAASASKREGMEQSSASAGSDWNYNAKKMLLRFLKTPEARGEFMAEDIRGYAKRNGLDTPPSERAWGSVIVDAMRKKLIKHVAYGKVKNVKAHQANANVYIQL